jgi:hypothetical protein
MVADPATLRAAATVPVAVIGGMVGVPVTVTPAGSWVMVR